jgi:hypothetical protein
VVCCREGGNELSSSMTCEKRLDQRSDSLLFKDSGPCSTIRSVRNLMVFSSLAVK